MNKLNYYQSPMFQHLSAFSGFSVSDIAAAETFYRNTLGLNVSSEMLGTLRLDFKGSSSVFIYSKENHEPATYTVLNFVVEDIDEAVEELIAAGVKMEIYEGFGQDSKGISRGQEGQSGPAGIAWFKDPSGNILSVIQE